MGERFVLAIRDAGTKNKIYKARFTVQSYTGDEKQMLVHACSNLKQQTIRIPIAIATLFGFKIWSQDVSKAYLQNTAT